MYFDIDKSASGLILVHYCISSGMLNSKTRELTALQEETAARLAQTKIAFLEGMKAAREVKADLEYVHKRVKYDASRAILPNIESLTQHQYRVGIFSLRPNKSTLKSMG